jgi:hypothetical protein
MTMVLARIPATAAFQEKWRQSHTLIRRARAAGLKVTAVVADASSGISRRSDACCIRGTCPCAGISHQLTVFHGTPAVHLPLSARMGRPRSQRAFRNQTHAIAVRVGAGAAAACLASRDVAQWHQRSRAARFAALRVTPANEWRNRRLAPEVWLLCDQDVVLTR